MYRADVRGSEAVTVVHDGQDRDTIEAVERDCELVAFIETRSGVLPGDKGDDDASR